jgi:Ca2+-binding EF-hand superfamily protein
LIEARKGGLGKDDEKKVRALINSKIDKMYPGEANEKWFDLFKSIDEDCSGLLDQDEIKVGIREKMGISTDELSDAMFKAFWITLDEDDSGTVESAEFHRFLHREEPKGAIERRQEAMRASSKRKRAEMSPSAL